MFIHKPLESHGNFLKTDNIYLVLKAFYKAKTSHPHVFSTTSVAQKPSAVGAALNVVLECFDPGSVSQNWNFWTR